ncbi:Pls/PosA family non-ribosomal peptide synthetase [Allokutzneria albata]|uniref:Carrier domain-containing protein n=1 Tax=Allokutzneria albata TaxID=211114 RepID=A0A1G9UY06_ALLAB|nr:Pls/PosA family non-ribosomal peptide synthetase [Allokutzneria albata]SDM64854.1 non-ribosomal peptide synthetase terminal domain of unknown function [Allokutzneria albata]
MVEVPAEDLAGHPTTGTERILAAALADVVRVRNVSVDSHFFDDLGANSLVMAHFCARIRKRADLPPVSMKDVYRHPTIRSLATMLAESALAPVSPSVPVPTEAAPPRGTPRYVLCGLLQVLVFLGYSSFAGIVVTRCATWISASSGPIEVYLRAVVVGGVGFLALSALPVLAKWLLIGRSKPQRIRVWSLAYVRFWVVKALLRSSPLVLFAGSPLYVLYLRALGARIGRGVVIFAKQVPVCADLLTVGDGTVIRKDSYLSCYRAHDGVIETGPVTLGRDVFVSEATVIDIGTSLGDGAQLGHASSLHSGQAVPAGQRWHGSPAQPTDVDYRAVRSTPCGPLRRAVYSAVQLVGVLLVRLPLTIGVVYLLLTEIPHVAALLEPGSPTLTSWTFYRDAFVASVLLFVGFGVIGLLFVVVVPRVLNLAITPGKVYPLYGVHYAVHRTITRTTNSKFLTRLFGDSSAIVHYLRLIGYDLSRVEQTGSNFGTEVRHETPFLSSVGSSTMIADGLSIMNADYSATSFRVSRAVIGAHNFLGNRIAFPAGGRTGDNCLLATKVLVPVDGPVREGVGLLGSPSFEIPRSVERDTEFDHLKSEDQLRDRLAAKNRHNAVTMGIFLLVRWIHVLGLTLLAWTAMDLFHPFGAAALALFPVLALLFTVVYFVLVERAVTTSTPLTPLYCSIYDVRFWRRERYWKVPSETYLEFFNGTPFKNVVSRSLGVRIGRGVFDDGCFITERSLVAIGDHCTLNAGSVLQCHSQEDGAFKSDHCAIGARCTLGVGAFVHYGVVMGDGSALAPDSFLMKGEEVPPHAHWGGNPARESRSDRPQWTE